MRSASILLITLCLVAAYANFPNAVYTDGPALAHLNQDEAAKSQFEKFVKMSTDDDLERRRALRYISEPSLARARMAPPFEVTTTDGQRVSLDDFKGDASEGKLKKLLAQARELQLAQSPAH